MASNKQFIKNNPDKIPSIETIKDLILHGENKMIHSLVTEAILIDDKWLQTIQNYLMNVENVIKHAKSFIVDNELIQNIEKVKKITAKSIRHLASNTKYIASIDEKTGDVMPKKLLTVEIDENLAIYENRFVITLINRLSRFIDERYSSLVDIIQTKDTTELCIQSQSKIKRTEITIESNVRIREPSTNKILEEKNENLMRVLTVIKKRIAVMKNSALYRELNQLKPILPPIMKTNLITKNIDYNACYKLWVFISGYTMEGFEAEVGKKLLPVDDKYFQDVAEVMAEHVQTLIANDYIRRKDYDDIKSKEFKPKKFRLVNDYKTDFQFKEKNKNELPELVNQYYFEQVKELVSETVKTNEGEELEQEKKLAMTFPKFFKSLNRINRAIYLNLLELEEPQKISARTKKERIEKKREQLKTQETLVKRYRLLNKLAGQELQTMLKLESKELVKIDKLQFELKLLTDKNILKDPNKIDKSPKTRVNTQKKADTIIESTQEKIVARADMTEAELMEAERIRQESILTEKRIAYQRQTEEREKRLLARLKEKYPDEV